MRETGHLRSTARPTCTPGICKVRLTESSALQHLNLIHLRVSEGHSGAQTGSQDSWLQDRDRTNNPAHTDNSVGLGSVAFVGPFVSKAEN